MFQHNYQTHIDILRALAVILVILNHLDFALFSGGFIGVDVFFVISGYLITKNIIKEKQLTQKFSFRDFYRRRIIRLAPAFLTVILISSLFFLSVMTPLEIDDYLKTVIASLTLTSNIYYTSLLNDYFSITAKSTPLLHIWSLSLEEQFYLFWPLFIVLALRFRKLIGLALIGFIFTLSLFISHEIYKVNPTAAYYLLPSRVFEFAIGAGLAFIKPLKVSNFQSLFLGSISIFGIIAASILIDENTIFPSYIALIPCFFSALFISTAQFFSNSTLKSIQYLGKISYPMYLWHWPIIVYLSILSVSFNTTTKIFILLATLSLSVVSYEFIEKKAKLFLKNKQGAIKKIIMLPALILILCAYLANKQISSLKSTNLLMQDNLVKCIDQPQHPIEECVVGDLSQNKFDILLVGDSHANAISGFINQLSLNANTKGYELTQSATLFMPQTNLYKSFNGEYKKVEKFNNYNNLVENIIRKNSFKYIVFSGAFPAALAENIYKNRNEQKVFKEGIENSIKLILDNNAQPILVDDVPYLLTEIDTQCHIRSLNIEKCKYSRNLHDERVKEWNKILIELQSKYKTLIVIDMAKLICSDDYCYSHDQNIPLYRDTQHLNYRAGISLAQKYLETSENPFKKD